MSPEKIQLSHAYITILIMGFIFGSTVVISPGGDAGHDAWLAVLIGMVEGLIFVAIFALLAQRFKGKTIVEIATLVYGPLIGKTLSLIFLAYLFHLGSLVLSNFSRFFGLILPETPNRVFSLLIMLVCILSVQKGIEVIARCALIFVPINIAIILADTFLLINEMKLNNLLPILDVPIDKLLLAAHGAATFPFGETVVFLMLFCYLKTPNRGILVSSFLAVITAGMLIMIIVAQNFSVLGASTAVYIYPSFQTVQNINIADILNRIEILVAINLLNMGIIKISVLLFSTVSGTAQVLGLKSYRPLIIPFSILMIFLESITNVNTPEMLEFAQKTYPIYALPFQLGIPFLTLVLAIIRRLPQEGQLS
ncbi:MAG: endospore germination permease [Dehalobacterium sp.]